MSLNIEGGVQLAQALGRLEHSVSRQVKLNALMAAAEPIRDHAETLAPRDDSANAPHLDENIVIGRLTEKQLEVRGRETETVVEVGPAADFFYGFFQEHSTVFHGAQPFMGPAFDAEHVAALNILVDELWWALRRGTSGTERFVA